MSLYDDAVLVLKGYEDQPELRQVYLDHLAALVARARVGGDGRDEQRAGEGREGHLDGPAEAGGRGDGGGGGGDGGRGVDRGSHGVSFWSVRAVLPDDQNSRPPGDPGWRGLRPDSAGRSRFRPGGTAAT